MDFANIVRGKNYQDLTRTENEAIALKTTGSALLDLFAKIGAMRGADEGDLTALFLKAFEEDNLLAIKLLFYARNVRGGLGERETSRTLLEFLAKVKPEIVKKNIANIPHFGRWDDLYSLIGTPVESFMWYFLRDQLAKDTRLMKDGQPISLMAKWLKSPNTSSPWSRNLGKLTAAMLGISEKTYRITLSTLRKYIDVTERKMSLNEWDKIDYSHVPSYAMKNYKEAFEKRDPERFAQFVEDVQTGEKDIKASTLYPYDILMDGGLEIAGGWSRAFLRIEEHPVLEEQWKALPNYVDGENNIIVIADTSGSMGVDKGRPLATSVGLAVYFAERNTGVYKNLFMVFSRNPYFVELEGSTLAEKVSNIPVEMANTDLEKALELILEVAVENKIDQDQMPKSLVVVSDMHFDALSRGRSSLTKTLFQSLKERYIDEGYIMPTVIFWNVAQRANAFQVNKDEENVILVSGQSVSTFKSVLGNIGKTTADFMIETLNDPQYDCVVV